MTAPMLERPGSSGGVPLGGNHDTEIHNISRQPSRKIGKENILPVVQMGDLPRGAVLVRSLATNSKLPRPDSKSRASTTTPEPSSPRGKVMVSRVRGASPSTPRPSRSAISSTTKSSASQSNLGHLGSASASVTRTPSTKMGFSQVDHARLDARTTVTTQKPATNSPRRPGTASKIYPPLLAKPSFNTHVRSYSPIKPTNPRPSFSSPLKANATTRNTESPTLSTIRLQAHLLHHHALYTSAETTLNAYTTSAYHKLHDLHLSLQQSYNDIVLPLERQVCEQRNLSALHNWSGGNVVGLKRKLTVLLQVLSQLMYLTAPVRSSDSQTRFTETVGAEMDAQDYYDEVPAYELNGQEEGAYTRIAAQFEAWISWVQDVWQDRDAAATSSTTTFSPDETKPFIHIEGLGDAMKSEMRALATKLQAMDSRLHEAQGLSFRCPEAQGVLDIGEQSTPEIVLRLTKELLSGMREELQVMRELDCEVVLGEEMWFARRVESMRGYGT